MENELWFFTEMDLVTWTRYICQALERSADTEVKYDEYSDSITLSCKYFTVFIDTDELIGADVVEEYYGFIGNVAMIVQMFNRYYYEGVEQLIKLLRLVMDERKEDFLFLENGDLLVLKRQNNCLYTKISEGHSTQYPFEILGRPVQRLS